MKKFIDRMEAAQGESPIPSSGPGPGDKSGKKKWGLGGMVRRVTGSTTSANATGAGSGGGTDLGEDVQPAGLQVDFYLVIVCHP